LAIEVSVILAYLSGSDVLQAVGMLLVFGGLTFFVMWYCDKSRKEAKERGNEVEALVWGVMGYLVGIPIALLGTVIVGASITP
jgi:uncharacterized membrane protein